MGREAEGEFDVGTVRSIAALHSEAERRAGGGSRHGPLDLYRAHAGVGGVAGAWWEGGDAEAEERPEEGDGDGGCREHVGDVAVEGRSEML